MRKYSLRQQQVVLHRLSRMLSDTSAPETTATAVNKIKILKHRLNHRRTVATTNE